MKRYFFYISIVVFGLIGLLSGFFPDALWSLILFGPLFLIGIYDILQRRHTVWRNFPVIGHIRYMFEAIRPEIQQYFIEADWGGRPLNRLHRIAVYARAKRTDSLDTVPFGSQLDVTEIGSEWLLHSTSPTQVQNTEPRVMVGNEQCSQPYNASILNISAMSFGALSSNAILALNRGAKRGNFYHNTGEGGISPYHLKHGGDIVMQVGTAYFGCRTLDGEFSPERFKENALRPSVKMIELKISQGAKPGGGGILPAAKVTQEIAGIRGIKVGKDVRSPGGHSAFKTPIEMMHFLASLREMSDGKPIGFKLCVGRHEDFFAICKAMLETGIIVDFITVDGSEGGTGAAPMGFINSMGTPLNEGLTFVDDALRGCGLRDKIRLIASGKITMEFDVICKLAIGADMCNSARGMMLALGCIQSLRCNTNRCPTGVTTQDPGRAYGLVVEEKHKRVANFHNFTLAHVMELIAAAGLQSHADLSRFHILRRINYEKVKSYGELFPPVPVNSFLEDNIPEKYQHAWKSAVPNKWS